jgi:hypothetical protein
MDAESQLIEMLDNEFQLEIVKHMYEDFGFHPNLIENLTTSFKDRLDTEFHRKVSGLTHMDIHNPKI